MSVISSLKGRWWRNSLKIDEKKRIEIRRKTILDDRLQRQLLKKKEEKTCNERTTSAKITSLRCSSSLTGRNFFFLSSRTIRLNYPCKRIKISIRKFPQSLMHRKPWTFNEILQVLFSSWKRTILFWSLLKTMTLRLSTDEHTWQMTKVIDNRRKIPFRLDLCYVDEKSDCEKIKSFLFSFAIQLKFRASSTSTRCCRIFLFILTLMKRNKRREKQREKVMKAV